MRRSWSLVALIVLAGCSANRKTESIEPVGGTDPVTVLTENRRSDDIVVSLVRDGVRQRLGLVAAQTNGTFEVPWTGVANAGRVRVVATPIAGRRSFVSEQLVLRPGSEVTISVTPALGQSAVRVY
jgi:hypothetical protein